jgi:hypothetical protein
LEIGDTSAYFRVQYNIAHVVDELQLKGVFDVDFLWEKAAEI